MILTGKCADRFKEWLESSNHTPWVVFFESLPPLVQYAYYVEWFDEQEIFIDISSMYTIGNTEIKFYHNMDDSGIYPSRTEALKAAIEKGNLIFNER